MPYRIGKFDTKTGREVAQVTAGRTVRLYARRKDALRYMQDAAALMDSATVDASGGRLFSTSYNGFHFRIVHVPPTPKPKSGKVRKSVEMPQTLSDSLADAAKQGGTTVHGAMLEALHQYADGVLGTGRPCDDPEQVPAALRGEE